MRIFNGEMGDTFQEMRVGLLSTEAAGTGAIHHDLGSRHFRIRFSGYVCWILLESPGVRKDPTKYSRHRVSKLTSTPFWKP